MNNQQLQLVSSEQAKKLRDAGFDWRIYALYQCDGTLVEGCSVSDGHHGYAAPTVALALKWMRDVKGMLFDTIYVRHNYSPTKQHGWRGEYRIDNQTGATTEDFETYESAESALLDELLTLIEK